MFDSLAGGLVTLVTLAGIASGPGHADRAEPFQINLSSSDPAEIDDLPGILDDEAVLLRGVAGPGTGDLSERLLRTGIPRDRLIEWAPYLYIPAPAPGAAEWTTRMTAESRGGKGARARTDIRVAHPRWSGDLVSRVTAPSPRTGNPQGASLDGRVGVNLPPGTIWGGCLAGGLSGIDPWDDPLRSADAGAPPIPRAAPSARASARGLFFAGRTLSVAGWREKNEGGGLLAFRGDAAGIWFGRQGDAGRGGGVSLRPSGALLGASVHDPPGAPPVLRFVAAGPDGRSRLAVAWTAGERSDGRAGRLDGATDQEIRSIRIGLKTTLTTRAGPGPNSGRGTIGVTYRGNRGGITGESVWSGTGWRLRVAWDRELRSGIVLRVTARGLFEDGTSEGLLDFDAVARRGRVRLGGGGTMRTTGTLPWPSYAGADREARLAVHLKTAIQAGSAQVALAAVVPVAARLGSGAGAPFIQAGIEQRGSVRAGRPEAPRRS